MLATMERISRAGFALGARGALLALALVALGACQSSPWRRAEPYVDGGVAVYPEARFDEGERRVALGYAHPAELSAADLETLLASLRFRRGRLLMADEDDAVFSPDEAQRLAAALSRMLASISPDQRLRFLSVRNDRVLLFDNFLGSSGVLFASAPGRLELAFDRVREPLSIADGDPRQVRFPVEPTALLESAWTLIAPSGVRFHLQPEGGKLFPGWIQFDRAELAALKPLPSAPPAATPTPAAAVTEPAPPPPASSDAPRALPLLYKGCRLFQVGAEVFGLPQSEGALDLAKVRAGAYRLVFTGKSAREVTDAIDQAEAAGLLKP